MTVDATPRTWTRWLVLLATIAAFAIPTAIAARYVGLWHIFIGYVDAFSNLTGLNTYLTSVLAAVLFVPFFVGVSWSLSWRSGRRHIGEAILLTLFICYNLALFFGTQGANFGFAKGETLRWYAVTPDGVQYYDRPGTEPKYGVELRPVTKDVARQLDLMQRGEFKPVDQSIAIHSLFDPLTGEPQMWFHRYDDGRLEFYDKPGFHPATGKPLEPATNDVHGELERRQKEERQRQENAAAVALREEQARQARRAEAATVALRDEQARQARAVEAVAAARREEATRRSQAAERASRQVAVERELADARARAEHMARVTVLTFPPGAEVSIDRGKYRGITPFTIDLEPGTYGLKLALPGYEPRSDMIHVSSPTAQLQYTLKPGDQ